MSIVLIAPQTSNNAQFCKYIRFCFFFFFFFSIIVSSRLFLMTQFFTCKIGAHCSFLKLCRLLMMAYFNGSIEMSFILKRFQKYRVAFSNNFSVLQILFVSKWEVKIFRRPNVIFLRWSRICCKSVYVFLCCCF
jgi:hypothetical protein